MLGLLPLRKLIFIAVPCAKPAAKGTQAFPSQFLSGPVFTFYRLKLHTATRKWHKQRWRCSRRFKYVCYPRWVLGVGAGEYTGGSPD